MKLHFHAPIRAFAYYLIVLYDILIVCLIDVICKMIHIYICTYYMRVFSFLFTHFRIHTSLFIPSLFPFYYIRTFCSIAEPLSKVHTHIHMYLHFLYMSSFEVWEYIIITSFCRISERIFSSQYISIEPRDNLSE